LLKLGPVETGKARTSGTGGGGGHDTATGTGVAQPLIVSTQTSQSNLIFMVGILLYPFVFGRFRFGQLLCGFPFGFHSGDETVKPGLCGRQALPLHPPSPGATEGQPKRE
jgi:hypothetical protein